jgi:hypothetical protein
MHMHQIGGRSSSMAYECIHASDALAAWHTHACTNRLLTAAAERPEESCVPHLCVACPVGHCAVCNSFAGSASATGWCGDNIGGELQAAATGC